MSDAAFDALDALDALLKGPITHTAPRPPVVDSGAVALAPDTEREFAASESVSEPNGRAAAHADVVAAPVSAVHTVSASVAVPADTARVADVLAMLAAPLWEPTPFESEAAVSAQAVAAHVAATPAALAALRADNADPAGSASRLALRAPSRAALVRLWPDGVDASFVLGSPDESALPPSPSAQRARASVPAAASARAGSNANATASTGASASGSASAPVALSRPRVRLSETVEFSDGRSEPLQLVEDARLARALAQQERDPGSQTGARLPRGSRGSRSSRDSRRAHNNPATERPDAVPVAEPVFNDEATRHALTGDMAPEAVRELAFAQLRDIVNTSDDWALIEAAAKEIERREQTVAVPLLAPPPGAGR